MATRTTTRSKAQEALAIAQEVAAKVNDWQELWNALFGIEGRVTEMFTTRAAREQFSRTNEHAKIMQMLEELQENEPDEDDQTAELITAPGAKGRFVLRLPRSLHAALTAEAKAEGVSLNQLCVAKLATQLGKAVELR